MTKPVFQIVKQEYPVTLTPYKIVEVVMTSEGPRSRLQGGCFETFGDTCKRVRFLETGEGHVDQAELNFEG